jgi:hypothetical protein
MRPNTKWQAYGQRTSGPAKSQQIASKSGAIPRGMKILDRYWDYFEIGESNVGWRYDLGLLTVIYIEF